ncbi:MAG: hypothetical protein WBD74_12200, partial [Candidatus Aquilonibacter sp.]
FVPLDEQDPARWDHALIDEAESLLARAAAAKQLGRFQLEAAVQSAHAVRRLGRVPDYSAIVLLYDALLALTGSPVVGLNRAVALAACRGAAAGIDALDVFAGDARMVHYQPYWAARADMLSRCGETEAARIAFERAIGLAIDPAVRAYLVSRQEGMTHGNHVGSR